MARQIPAPEFEIPADEYDLGNANPFSLAGKHALVAGASEALGRALALGLAEAGADVSLTTAEEDTGQETRTSLLLDDCKALGRRGAMATVDLANPVKVVTAAGAIEAAIGPIDILVNAQHEANIKPVLESNVEEWRRELERNATSVFVTCQAVGKGMVRRGYGRIINVVSILHDRGVPNAAIFAASQGAVLGFTKSLGVEWSRLGVTVNALGIGFYDDVPGVQADEEVHAILERYIPLRRLGKPEDLQGALVYLASDAASFMGSELVTVDGAIQVHA